MTSGSRYVVEHTCRVWASTELRLQVIAATNRIDILDPALLRSGRLDRKIEFPLPNETARARILEIHSRKMTVAPDVNYEELARSTDEFNGAQLKAVCVEAGMIALREGATRLSHEHFLSGIAEGECPHSARALTGLTLDHSAEQEEELAQLLYVDCSLPPRTVVPTRRTLFCAMYYSLAFARWMILWTFSFRPPRG